MWPAGQFAVMPLPLFGSLWLAWCGLVEYLKEQSGKGRLIVAFACKKKEKKSQFYIWEEYNSFHGRNS